MDELTIDSLGREEAEYLFVYNDQYHAYFVIYSHTEKKAYLLITDKLFNIEVALPIEKGDTLFNAENVTWFKPSVFDNAISFSGRLMIDEVVYHFSFTEHATSLVLSEHKNGLAIIPNSYNLLSSMEHVEVIHGIQRHGFFYFVGYIVDPDGEEDNETVYGEVDLELDKVTRLYFLYSDLGIINPKSLTIDQHENKIYIAGNLTLDTGTVTPYTEVFLYSSKKVTS